MTMPLISFLIAAELASSSAYRFAPGRAQGASAALSARSRTRPMLQATPEPAETDTAVEAQAAGEEEAQGPELSAYVAEQKQQSVFSGLSLDFDFSGTPSRPTDVRGEGGLNEQGYRPYDKAALDSPDTAGGVPVYLIALGGAGLLIAVLTISNTAGFP